METLKTAAQWIAEKRWGLPLIALLAGALMPLGFAPFSAYPVPLISLILFLLCLNNASVKQAGLLGFLFGIGVFGVGASWVYVSIHVYGNAPVPLAALITGLFVVTLSLFFAGFSALCKRALPGQWTLWGLLGAGGLWVAFEWFRGVFLSGFPWLFLGYSQTDSPLYGYAPLIGVYGLSFLVWLTAALITASIQDLLKASHCTIVLLLLWSLGGLLNTVNWTKSTGYTSSVALVQGNIDQNLKWSASHIPQTLNTYKTLSQPFWKSDLVIWPEAAIPVPLPQAQDFLESMGAIAATTQATLITGIPIAAPDRQYYTAVVAVGNGEGVYKKSHLVPFGEYVPFEHWLRGLIDFFNLPMSSFKSGPPEQTPLHTLHHHIAVAICYEIAYPQLVRNNLQDADILLTVSNDTWFGRSIGPKQHLEIAQMRAKELGRPLLRATNNGLTAIIDAQGKIQAEAPPYGEHVLTGTVTGMEGSTLLARLGHHFIIIVLVLFFLGVAMLHRRVTPCL